MPNGDKQILISIPVADMLSSGDGQPYSETEKAYGFNFRHEIVWVPKSQVKDFALNFDNYTINFWCPSWLVKNKNLEVYQDTSFEPSLFI